VGIIGAGVVGRALGGALTERGIAVAYHDPPANQVLQTINRCRVAFVCVPTPFCPHRGVDVAAVRDALTQLAPGTVAVIRSTVLPGTTEALQAEFPKLLLMHAPEFLTEATAEQDERKPARQIVGYTAESKPFAHDVMALLPDAPVQALIVAREAEAVKYFANDLCQRLGVYWGMVQECASADPMMAPCHTEVNHGGYRGFAGKCLPKDTAALVHLADEYGVDLSLLREALRYNDTLGGA
jgi:UDPglucose 6-dehydrogenase